MGEGSAFFEPERLSSSEGVRRLHIALERSTVKVTSRIRDAFDVIRAAGVAALGDGVLGCCTIV
jgi:hypothetical protein